MDRRLGVVRGFGRGMVSPKRGGACLGETSWAAAVLGARSG